MYWQTISYQLLFHKRTAQTSFLLKLNNLLVNDLKKNNLGVDLCTSLEYNVLLSNIYIILFLYVNVFAVIF